METILNVHNFHSVKKNQDYSVLTILRDFTQRDVDSGFIGKQIAEEVFLPDKLVNKFGANDIGKAIERKYTIVGGKAFLDDVVLK